MEPLDDHELKELVSAWKAPEAPQHLHRQIFGAPRRSWWAWLLTGGIRVPVPACAAALLLVAWLAFGYVSVLSMFLGFFAFYRGMSEAGIARVSQIQLAQPVCSLLWSALLLGEHIDVATAVAAVFVVGCVLVTSRTRVRVVYAVPEAP